MLAPAGVVHLLPLLLPRPPPSRCPGAFSVIPESASIWVARASRGREYLIQYHREYLQGWGPGRGECGHFLAVNGPGVLAGAGRVWLLGVCQTWYYTWGYVTDCVLSTFHKWHNVQYRRVIITVIARDGICQTYSMVLNMGLGDRLRAVRISLAAKTDV